jgi:hypothetical protein
MRFATDDIVEAIGTHEWAGMQIKVTGMNREGSIVYGVVFKPVEASSREVGNPVSFWTRNVKFVDGSNDGEPLKRVKQIIFKEKGWGPCPSK